LQYIFLAGSFLIVTSLNLASLVAPPLSGTLWDEESVILGPDETLAFGVGATLTVTSEITEIVELIA
jgi:hypothetical protein